MQMPAWQQQDGQPANRVQVFAPAKLNLFLEILGKRPDGFHEIETLMVAIDRYDTLTIAENPSGQLTLRCGWATGLVAQRAINARPIKSQKVATTEQTSAWGDLPLGADNLVLKAVEVLRRRAGIKSGADIELVKRIPSAAGLGGASSDAAAALLAAAAVWKLDWNRQRLAEVAAELGSDIPFFLGTGPAVCRGRGERIKPIVSGGPLHVVVVRPPAGLSTPAVYQHCRPATSPQPIAPLAEAFASGNAQGVARGLCNRLQPPALELSPWVGRLQKLFASLDVVGHQMTGSGSSYFGIARNAKHARHLAGRLRGANVGAVFAAKTLIGPSLAIGHC